MEFVEAFICLIALSADVLCQLGSFRLFGRKNLLRSQAVGFVGGLICLFYVYFFFLGHSDLSVFTAHLIGYGALVYGYFHFLNLGETARRIRIMRELRSVHPRGLSYLEITTRYGAPEMVEKRIHRLLKTQQIIIQDNRYFIKDKTLLRISNIILFLKKLIIGKNLEFTRTLNQN